MIFAASIMATKQSTETIDRSIGLTRTTVGSVHTAMVIDADSRAEAEAKAHLCAIERWRKEDGWEHHSAEVIKVNV